MAENNKKKKKLIILIISIAAALVLILAMSLTFVFVFSKKDGGGDHPTPPVDDKVTLEWGEHSTADIDDLLVGEERGPYEIGLKATRKMDEEFTGKFSVSITSESHAEYRLIDYIYVEVYQHVDKQDVLFTIDKDDETKEKTADVTIVNHEEKTLYFYVGLPDDISPLIFDQMSDEFVYITFDWGN